MTPAAAPARTPQADLDRFANRLREASSRFALLALAERRRLLDAMTAGIASVAPAMVRAACEAKRIQAGSPTAGEEWSLGPVITLQNMRLLKEALASIGRSGTTRIGPIDQTIDGRAQVTIFPATPLDRVLFSGITAQAHLAASAKPQDRARFYREAAHEGRVVLVLGAGNVNAITPLDVATKMFNEGKVCIVKISPVNAYLGPLLEEAFRAAIASDFLAITYGGAEEGEYLAFHPAVDEVHLTGSDATHEALVWGPPGAERNARKAAGSPRLRKPVTSELGNISPVIVVPGRYSERQLRWQVENIAGGITNNASFNCNAHKLLISATGRVQTGGLLGLLEKSLARVPPRYAYYPGAEERYRALTRGRPGLLRIGQAGPGELPWTVIPGIESNDPRDSAFRTEPFCAVLSQASIDCAGPLEFLERAVDFVNRRVWGTLVATIVIPPSLRRDPSIRAALDRAVVALRYGTVGVNIWGAYGFALGPPWGGHPSSSLEDIQSGLGFVHNASMLEGVEKTVIEQPIVNWPKPVHFPTHRSAASLGRALTGVEATGNWAGLPAVLGAAIRA
ncbi:MAG TPA: aldehyde dehydrogenase [Candidatus Dormibacteraeota bacterium]